MPRLTAPLISADRRLARSLIRLRDSLGDAAPQSLLDAIHAVECRLMRAERHASPRPSWWAWLSSVVRGWGFLSAEIVR